MITGGPPVSTAAILQQRHIEVTRDGLLGALKNPDAQVRYLAAEKLAEDKMTDAIPSIAEAVAIEKVPATRLNMAYALALLGDKQGILVLKTACDSRDLSSYLRARAAQYLLDMHTESCLNSMLDMLQTTTEPESRSEALSVLRSFEHVSKEDTQRMFALAVKALQDQTPAVRIDASITLATLGNISAITYLRRAMANERDQVVRSQFQDTIRALQQKQASQ